MADAAYSLTWLLFAQAPPGAGGGAGGGNAGGGGLFDVTMLPLLMVIMVLFYFIVMLPERRRRREMQSVLEGLKENDRVVTIGGMIGTVVQFAKDGSEVVLRVDDKTNTRIRVLRSAIDRPLKEESSEASDSAKKT